jgi:hypothetical protein
MTIALLMLAAFASAALLDLVGIAWHRAREAGQRWRGTGIAMLHEALAWAPLLLALEASGRSPALAVAAVAGVGVANSVGLRRSRP